MKYSPSVLILGYGVVGRNLADELAPLHPCIYDLRMPDEDDRRPSQGPFDFCFICIDTPHMDEIDAPLDDLVSALNDPLNLATIYIIKSTIPPGSIEQLRKLTGKRIIFSPEYYGGTQHCNNFNFDFTILGGEKEDCIAVQNLLQNVYDARHTFHIVDARTAELVKYMENSWLATKVSFCIQFYEIAQQAGVDYETLRELFILDPRVNPSHTFVYPDHPYWDSHCLNKDVPTIAFKYDAPLLDAVISFNKMQKEKD